MITAICIIAAVLLTVWCASGFVFYNMTLARRVGDTFRREMREPPKDDNARTLAAWVAALDPAMERVTIQSADGVNLAGLVFKRSESKRWVIAVHGHGCGKEFMLYAVQQFYNWGINVLSIDLRAHGESGGNAIGMGWLDRFDIAEWARWIEKRYANCEIVLYGISMGAATILSASGEDQPACVKALVADCGFTCAAGVFAHLVKKLFHLPAWFAMPPFAAVARLRAGFNIYKASPLNQLKKGGTLPVLITHGEADDFVPFAMAKPLYEAAGSRARLFTVKDAGHGECCIKDPDGYWSVVRSFIDGIF